MFTILDYSSALEYSIIRRYTMMMTDLQLGVYVHICLMSHRTLFAYIHVHRQTNPEEVYVVINIV